MKYVYHIFILLIALQVSRTYAQNGLSLGFHSVQTGRNIAATFNKSFKKHTFYLGPKFLINRTPVDNQNHVFYKRFHASNFKEHFGLVFGYHFIFRKSDQGFSPLIFVDFQYLNASLRRYGFNFSLLPNGGIKGLTFKDERLGSTTALENSLGVGFRVHLTEYLSLIEKIGLNYNLFTDLPKKYFLERISTEFGLILSASLVYNL
jgi:hypothetical protein